MLKTIDDVVNRLIEQYKPEKVILYGSCSKSGIPEKGSDVDLLVVKDTDRRLIDRLIEVESLLSDRTLPLDIMVYTPEEMRRLFSLGSPFIEEVLEKGRLLYMRKATGSWIKEAKDEFDSAVILYEHEKYRGACYHSQQSVEKGLKALILEKGKKPERIHDIVELLNVVKDQGWDVELTVDDAVFLNSVYKGRYPTEEGLLPHGEPLREDAGRAISAAGKLVNNLSDVETKGLI
jgi:HEPN domain-containing protein/predicted nucleotidyltransferase